MKPTMSNDCMFPQPNERSRSSRRKGASQTNHGNADLREESRRQGSRDILQRVMANGTSKDSSCCGNTKSQNPNSLCFSVMENKAEVTKTKSRLLVAEPELWDEPKFQNTTHCVCAAYHCLEHNVGDVEVKTLGTGEGGGRRGGKDLKLTLDRP